MRWFFGSLFSAGNHRPKPIHKPENHSNTAQNHEKNHPKTPQKPPTSGNLSKTFQKNEVYQKNQPRKLPENSKVLKPTEPQTLGVRRSWSPSEGANLKHWKKNSPRASDLARSQWLQKPPIFFGCFMVFGCLWCCSVALSGCSVCFCRFGGDFLNLWPY